MKSSIAEQFVAYYRVSTKGQGESGLGIDAQKASVYRKYGQDNVIAEYAEVESGKKNQRPELNKAIEYAKKNGVTLVIAKLDRLSRSAAFIFALRDAGIAFACCDLPELNTLTLGIFASLAQYERELISERTKAALAAKKAQGYRLGKPENLTDEARARSIASRKAGAIDRECNRQAWSVIRDLMGKSSLRGIARKLNEYGFTTRQGKEFSVVQVICLIRLYQENEHDQKIA